MRPRHDRRSTRNAAVLLALVGVLLLGACSSGSDAADKPVRDPRSGASSAALPEPGDDAAPFCADLVADQVVLDLRTALRGSVLGRHGAQNKLHAAADQLRTYADDGLGDSASTAADALDALAEHPADGAAAKRFAHATTQLDEAMEETCDLS